jgi:mRNA interferase MazF
VKEPGQIVLFRFPQADLSEGKLRPALLLSEVPGPYKDWLICMISSQVHQRIDGFDELIEEDGMLEGSIGTISPERMQQIRTRLAAWVGDSKER